METCKRYHEMANVVRRSAIYGRLTSAGRSCYCCFRPTRSDILNNYPSVKSKITVIYPGLSKLTKESEIKTRSLEVWGIDRPYALFVGTLEPRKNLKGLLESYGNLPAYVRDQLLLVIVGGQGWRLDNLPEIISGYGLERSVRITGFVSDSQLAELYASSRFLVMPSLYEGFGFLSSKPRAMVKL